MKAPTRREAAALAAGAAESNRDAWWNMLPLRDRERAVGVAGMQRERAALPLATFSDQEREQVRLALSSHIAQMETIIRCMAAHNTNVQGWLH
jgi:hypothetical protein